MGKNSIYLSTFSESKITKSENLVKFIKDFRSNKVLSQSEIDDLYKKIEESDDNEEKKQMYDYIVQCNLRLVLSMAKKYATNSSELDDFVQIGSIGLILGVEKYDYHVGALFPAYVLQYIRREINLYRLSNKTILKSNYLKAHSANKIANLFFLKHGRELTKEELLELYNEQNENYQLCDADDLIQIQCTSLDDVYEDNQMNNIQFDFNKETQTLNDIEFINQNEYNQFLVKNLVNELTPKEQKVINTLFGVNDTEIHDVKTIAHELGLTEERIRQIKDKAISKMKFIVSEKCMAR